MGIQIVKTLLLKTSLERVGAIPTPEIHLSLGHRDQPEHAGSHDSWMFKRFAIEVWKGNEPVGAGRSVEPRATKVDGVPETKMTARTMKMGNRKEEFRQPSIVVMRPYEQKQLNGVGI